MLELAKVFIVLAIIAQAIAQILTDPRITKKFLAKSTVAFALYAAHVAIAILVVAYLIPKGPASATGVTTAVLGWIGLGALGLIRFAPRLREPPTFLMHFGIADIVCLLLIGAGVMSANGMLS
jgi:hypothetical protein